MRYLLLLFLSTYISFAESGNDYVEANFITEFETVTLGQEFLIGINYKIDTDWHIYWSNPGDSGLPTEIEWSIPEGFEIESTDYPTPEKIPFSGMANFGYSNEVLITAKVKLVKELKNGVYKFSAKSKWLVCKEKCIPGSNDLSLKIIIANKSKKSKYYDYFQQKFQKKPLSHSDWAFRAEIHGDRIFLDMKKPNYFSDEITDLVFFPEEIGYFVNADIPKIEKTDFGYRVYLNLDNFRENNPTDLKGIIKINSNWNKESTNNSIKLSIPIRNL